MAPDQRPPDAPDYDDPGTRGPEVSVCVPAFNAAPWIGEAVRSALAQSHEDLEVVVVDNASTDRTVGEVLGIDDRRVRLYSNSSNLGVYGNFNRCIALSRGRHIQFLCADDILYPDCVDAMLAVFRSDPGVGLCFAPRDVELVDPGDEDARRWKANHETAYARFGELGEVNDGAGLLRPWIEDSFAMNWIGEPTNVMMSRECLQTIGTFPLQMRERGDMELWARAMLVGSIGFVDRPLTRYRVRPDSLTASNRASAQAWLDRLWLLEGLLSLDGTRRRFPGIARLRRRALARSALNLLQRRRTPRDGKLEDVGRYLQVRLGGRRKRSMLRGRIGDVGEPGETIEIVRPASNGEGANNAALGPQRGRTARSG